jgi:hypothetical protein
MAYVSYLHMEKKYRQLIEVVPLSNVIENEDTSIPLQSRISQLVPADSQNTIDVPDDTTTLFGDEVEISPSMSTAQRGITDDSISRKSEQYLRNETNIPTEGQDMPASDTVRDLNLNDELSSTVTTRALIHGPQQHRQNPARPMVSDIQTPDEQEQLLGSPLNDSGEQDEPPSLPEKNSWNKSITTTH